MHSEYVNDTSTRGRLDWCCIGAQKAGTSSLYRLLRDHPQIRIPSSKEDPIFDREVTVAEVDAYLDERFADPGEARCGTVTPQYLSAPDTAARMHAFAPDARIIALLRDPVTRALSHYRMSVLRELETRPFDEAVADQLVALQGAREIDLYSETDSYVVRGNYAWLLAGWYELYGADRILVLFADDLDQRTADTVARAQAFLGVEPQAPAAEEIDFRFNAAPPPHRFSHWRKPVARALRSTGAWQRLNPELREKISTRVEHTLARAVPATAPARAMTPETEQALRDYYAPGLAPLVELIGVTPPWATTV